MSLIVTEPLIRHKKTSNEQKNMQLE